MKNNNYFVRKDIYNCISSVPIARQGPIGPSGPPGAPGLIGPTGPVGPTGPAGVGGALLASGSGGPVSSFDVSGFDFTNYITNELYIVIENLTEDEFLNMKASVDGGVNFPNLFVTSAYQKPGTTTGLAAGVQANVAPAAFVCFIMNQNTTGYAVIEISKSLGPNLAQGIIFDSAFVFDDLNQVRGVAEFADYQTNTIDLIQFLTNSNTSLMNYEWRLIGK